MRCQLFLRPFALVLTLTLTLTLILTLILTLTRFPQHHLWPSTATLYRHHRQSDRLRLRHHEGPVETHSLVIA